MPSPVVKLRARWKTCVALGVAALVLLAAPRLVEAQIAQGVEKGAREGNKAAGPVGGVLGGAIGGVVGMVTGVTGVLTGNSNNSNATAANGKSGPSQPAAPADKTGAKAAKSAKASREASKQASKDAPKDAAMDAAKDAAKDKGAKQPAVLTQDGAPQLTAEQIVANSDADIDRIKKELDLTPEQEKQWSGFNSAMHYLGHNGADRLNLRIARAQRDPPDDIIEQMRNEAQFLNDRAVDQRNVADAAEPLYASLDDKQKQIFINEMVRLSHERGLD
ncbi:Spy/CpxP family protein refolding chaperone [Bradyrhizobium jicamae]|uniref:Spy/CpxP family protein refolding chaperone n=1 Tax=Bradyrhizobium jicamae TaxID=280332 RepID=A0ABS5FPW4_9BRAD|nr:Spy/CpxP family protein refolding chaperone [Bradyrhizobium jicamae]MBR0798830.1 Spy/CpxP family protein refolding chaperone [Bradyrhizobium jicamae]MBR0934722.1 Spy/CpxP family protein refolding chaperone [Bradyrhizobium jicamae]